MSWFTDENLRLDAFPVARERIFLAHAGVTILPRCAADAMRSHVEASCLHHQEFGDVLRDVARTRGVCAKVIGAHPDEIALLGPTSLGLSLFANGLDWKAGDELVCHADDYPSNVYPWTALAARGVVIRYVRTESPGRITVEAVEEALTEKTKLVALASAHFLSGWQIDVDAIGKLLQSRGILFSVDAIQTVGAGPFSVEHVDFLSADAHKWMLGPLAIGIVYVAKRNFERCRPTLLGAWNVRSPEFVAQKEIVFEETARRYEPGVLNIAGMYGMRASLEMLLAVGLGNVRSSILQVRDALQGQLREMGFVFLSPDEADPMRTGILTALHPAKDTALLFSKLEEAGIVASLRTGRDGLRWLRFSPHFYNSLSEIQRVVEVLGREVR